LRYHCSGNRSIQRLLKLHFSSFSILSPFQPTFEFILFQAHTYTQNLTVNQRHTCFQLFSNNHILSTFRPFDTLQTSKIIQTSTSTESLPLRNFLKSKHHPHNKRPHLFNLIHSVSSQSGGIVRSASPFTSLSTFRSPPAPPQLFSL
jgi:hypothetical protein